ALVPEEAALGEHERTRARGEAAQQPAHHLLGVPEAVDGGGVDPVHAALERAPHGGQGGLVVLRPPAERPAASSGRPGADAHPLDRWSAVPERTGGKASIGAAHRVTSVSRHHRRAAAGSVSRAGPPREGPPTSGKGGQDRRGPRRAGMVIRTSAERAITFS